MLFRRKKKGEPHKGDILLANGIYLQKPVMDNGHIIRNCFLRSMIVFLLTFGSIGGFLSALSISYNYIIVVVCYLLLSMYFSVLYAASKFVYRDLGYILFFGAFVVAIFKFRVYANSGFYAIVNTLLQRAQTFFDLSGVREYETQIDNSYLTVAIVAVFIGMVIIIILNIWLYSTMSIFWTVLLTFPLLLIPLYMKMTPDALYMIALGAGYFAVVLFKANGHYLAFAWDTPFHLKGLKKDRIVYTQDRKIFGQILNRVVAFIFCIVIITAAVVPSASFEGRFKSDKLRELTSETLGNFVLLGFEGLFNHYASTAGISGGKLGGVSNVRPDYEPDLLVTFAPYNNEAIYLKAYTGGIYGENEWRSIYEEGYGEETNNLEIFEEESLKAEAEDLQQKAFAAEEKSGYGQMDVKNVGASISYLYYPYYTVFENYTDFSNYGLMESVQGLGIQEEVSYEYYPKVEWEASMGNIKVSDIAHDKIPDVYLDVPEKNQAVISEECEKIGLQENMTENEVILMVQDYFEENIPYTLKPGATPGNEDFVNYFLTKNRKGYCAHFASSAVLIFRNMGIPARYVEGYAFDFETALASDENLEKRYSDYYQGYSTIGESTVLDVEVTDSMAHAWVEVYIPDFGWKVVEVTPGSNEILEEDDFWSAFSDIFDSGMEDETNDATLNIGDLSLSKVKWLIDVVMIILGLCFCVAMGRIAIRKGRRYRRCHNKDVKEALVAQYADLCDRLRMCNPAFNQCRSHVEQMQYMKRNYGIEFNIKEYSGWMEQISFSMEVISEEQMELLVDFMKQMRKVIWKQAGLRNKIRLYKR